MSGDTNGVNHGFVTRTIDDVTAPVVTMTRPSQRWTTALTARTQWTTQPDVSGVADSDLQMGVARWNRTGISWSEVTGVSGSVLHARSQHGWPHLLLASVVNRQCRQHLCIRRTALPGDPADRGPATTFGSRSERVTASDAYRGTLVRTTTNGAKLSLEGALGEAARIVATMCSTCGSVRVKWNGSAIATLNLTSASKKRQQVFELAPFGSTQSGTVVVEVTSPSGKTVVIEGIGLYQPAV